MKRVFYLLLIGIMSLPLSLAAQEEQEKLEKPDNIEDETFDTFKNSAFKIYNLSLDFKAKVDAEEPFSKEDLDQLEGLNDELATLQEQGPDLLPAAKKLRPMKNIKLGLQSAKTSIKAVKYAIENITYVLENAMKSE